MSVLTKKISLTRLLRSLVFSEEEVLHATIEQAKLFSKAAIIRVQKMRAKNEAEAKLNVLRAEIAIRVREEESKSKPTETYVKDRVAKNIKYQKAISEFNRCEEEEKFASLLIDAYEQRMWSLKIISSLTGMEQAVEKKMKEQAEELGKRRKRIESKFGDD